MHQTCKKSSLSMTYKLDDMIELPKSHPKETYKEDLDSEMVMVKIPRCMQWLDTYDEPIGDLDIMEDEAENPSPLRTPREDEHLDQTKLEDVGLDTCNHEIPLSSKEILSVDELEPQLLPNFPPLDVNLGDKRGTEPPINPYSSSSFRMKLVKPLTIHTPPSPHVASFNPKDIIEDDWKLEFKEVSFLEEGLNLPVRPKEVEKVRIEDSHHIERIFQQVSQYKALSYHHENEEESIYSVWRQTLLERTSSVFWRTVLPEFVS
ncbi:hypothetical protein Tco_1057927 [Tanacetum coccineum]|uniref:Uncharacterized protein n=1 Tax=Tanacetum coccineum TaxID=301880 RepID=A0ABQ5H6S6_9ASTR